MLGRTGRGELSAQVFRSTCACGERRQIHHLRHVVGAALTRTISDKAEPARRRGDLLEKRACCADGRLGHLSRCQPAEVVGLAGQA